MVISGPRDFMPEGNDVVESFFNGNVGDGIGEQINQNAAVSEYLSKIIYKRTTEWKYDQKYLDALLGVNNVHRERMEVLLRHICFWDDQSGLLPQQPVFYYAHPIRFIAHIKAIIAEKQKMIRCVQDVVMGMPSYEQNNYGNWPYNIGNPVGQTYCNQAVFTTIRTLDSNYGKFLNDFLNIDDRGDNGGRTDAPNSTYYYTEGGNSSNYWCNLLDHAARKDESIVELTMEDAQRYANRGYLVIGSYKNTSGAPHFVTVRPGAEYLAEGGGALVAHVGAKPNGVKRVADTDYKNGAFRTIPFQNIKWYHNKNQVLYLNWKVHINHFRWRVR